MSSRTLWRLGGLTAIIAGLSRSTLSFSPYSEPAVALEVLYLAVDLSILFGCLGIYFYQSAEVGISGFIGFLLAVTGTAIVVGPDSDLGGLSMYEFGALTLSMGLTILAVASWNAGRLPKYALTCWILSTVVGVGGFIIDGPDAMFLSAGLFFGIGFIGAGVRIYLDPVSNNDGDATNPFV